MDRGFEQLSVDFTIKAQKLFITTYEMFRLSTKKLDRVKDENVFQLQLGKYLKTLRSQLEDVAHESALKNKTIKKFGQCNKFLEDRITIYLREFHQKAKCL